MTRLRYWLCAEGIAFLVGLKTFAIAGGIAALHTDPESWWHVGGIWALSMVGVSNAVAIFVHMAYEVDGEFSD